MGMAFLRLMRFVVRYILYKYYVKSKSAKHVYCLLSTEVTEFVFSEHPIRNVTNILAKTLQVIFDFCHSLIVGDVTWSY